MAVVVWSWDASCVTVKVTVRLAGSCRRMGGVAGHLEKWVGFARVLFGNLISEQHPGELNPLLQMAINTSHPPT